MNKFSEQINISDIPADALNFVCEAKFDSFAQDGEDKNKLRLQFYDGGINYHWYWGNFAFDMGSIKLAKKKVGIFDSHDTGKRLGIGSKLTVDNVATIEGVFLDNPEADAVKKDALSGFPFEASMCFDPTTAKIEYIKEGQSVVVNGNTLKGPGTYISNTVVKEVSICAFGALKNCNTEVFNKNLNIVERKNIMPEQTKTELTVDSFKADHADIYNSVFSAGKAEGEKSERDHLAALNEKFGEKPAFVLDQFENGASIEEAALAFIDVLKADKDAEIEAAKNAAGEVADPADFFMSDDNKSEKKANAEPANFMDAVCKYQKENNCTQAVAIDKCASLYPDLHQKMREGK